jgi:FkbH-like protein
MPTTAAETQTASPQISVAATFTAEPLEEPLRFWLHELGATGQVVFAPPEQLFQTLLDPNSVFAGNRTGVNVALFRLEDLGEPAHWETHGTELVNALASAAAGLKVPLLVCLCPASSRSLETSEQQQAVERIENHLAALLCDKPNLYVISADRMIARYRVTEVEDQRAERAGRVPYQPCFFAALGSEIARIWLALRRKPLKVVAFDCDNTLWTGVCGEDGPQGVLVDAGRLALQRFLLQQKQEGVLLAINSKNNEADVRETFASHPDMLLRWDDITAYRINWEAKSKNLLELAFELNLGLDSFAFLDDDAKECAEVRSELPEVVTLRLPEESSQVSCFLEHSWIFDRVQAVTEADRQRSRLYAEQLERSRFAKQARDLQEFIAGLRLEILFAPVTPETLSRAAQLTQRTNQMNAVLARYGEAELKAALDDAQAHAFTVTVSDRFGSYGLVGLVMMREETDALRIGNFLLSCRALGRGVEHKMFAHAAELAEGLGKKFLRITVKRGARNQPAVQFFESVAACRPAGERTELKCEASEVRRLELRENGASAAAGQTEEGRSRSAVSSSAVDYQRIAAELDTAQRIQAVMEEQRRKTAASAKRRVRPPENELQEKIARIWRDLLGLEAVGIDEDFFDLGGHSLMAVQLLSRIHHELKVDLPDSVIYGEKLRVDHLARTVELQQLGVGDQSIYENMLAEIESLSDEEVAALLAEEGQF